MLRSSRRSIRLRCGASFGRRPAVCRWLFKINTFHHQGTDFLIYVFTERYDGSALTLGEGKGMGWFKPDETGSLPMNEHDRSVMRDLGQALASNVL